MNTGKKSADPAEIDHFAKDSARWWDENGPFAPLHKLNPVRLRYIRDSITANIPDIKDGMKPLEGLKILDIGCGGGLVCEPLARMGAQVTGIDADKQAIAIAKEHAAGENLTINYQATMAEDLEEQNFDVVLALEIIEHVTDINSFVQSCANLCRSDGLIIFSTLNKTAKSFALGIVAAEYILRWVPKGTHSWHKFVRPSQLAAALRKAGTKPVEQKGMIFNPLKGAFLLSDTDMDVNYFMSARKL